MQVERDVCGIKLKLKIDGYGLEGKVCIQVYIYGGGSDIYVADGMEHMDNLYNDPFAIRTIRDSWMGHNTRKSQTLLWSWIRCGSLEREKASNNKL